MNTFRIDAVYSTHPEARSSDDDGFYNSNGDKISLDESKVTTELDRLQTEYDALQYQRDRQYPSIGNQLDLLFHDMTAGKGSKTGEWYKEIA